MPATLLSQAPWLPGTPAVSSLPYTRPLLTSVAGTYLSGHFTLTLDIQRVKLTAQLRGPSKPSCRHCVGTVERPRFCNLENDPFLPISA